VDEGIAASSEIPDQCLHPSLIPSVQREIDAMPASHFQPSHEISPEPEKERVQCYMFSRGFAAAVESKSVVRLCLRCIRHKNDSWNTGKLEVVGGGVRQRELTIR
jgi:hypothetical protein